jgi:hypothetical protein
VTVKARDTRGMIAAIRHDLKAGNLERARRWMGELADGYWRGSSPKQLEAACTEIESLLEGTGL